MSMGRPAKLLSKIGCLISVVGPIVALFLYPRAKWLFALFGLGIAVIVINALFAKGATPSQIAEMAERLLDGTPAQWDIDDYEYLNPREPQLRGLWEKTMNVGGMPEGWPELRETQKSELREIINQIRKLAEPSNQS